MTCAKKLSLMRYCVAKALFLLPTGKKKLIVISACELKNRKTHEQKWFLFASKLSCKLVALFPSASFHAESWYWGWKGVLVIRPWHILYQPSPVNHFWHPSPFNHFYHPSPESLPFQRPVHLAHFLSIIFTPISPCSRAHCDHRSSAKISPMPIMPFLSIFLDAFSHLFKYMRVRPYFRPDDFLRDGLLGLNFNKVVSSSWNFANWKIIRR